MQKNRRAIQARIAAAFEFPEDTLGGVSSVTVTGSYELNANECKSIMAYTEDCVKLRMCDMILTVHGSRLILNAFSGGQITVTGKITGVQFE